MKKEQTVDYNLKVAWHGIMRMYNQYGQDFDITASTGFVLLNIDGEEGTPATKIAPALGMEARSLTRMLKSLEEKKWIYREPDSKDGRSIRIFLTELGKEKRELSRYAVKEFNNQVSSRVTSDDLKIFFKVLKEVSATINSNIVFEKLEELLAPHITKLNHN
ncbi:MAG: MarR family transcriptional regulator [Cytophagales bacterium]|nr:MarR family transcriptional regulator [Cytophagales bacterium]